MQVTCWSGEWRWHVAMQCGRDRAATRSPCSDSQRRAATRSPRSPHSSSRPQLGSPGSGEQGAVRGCGGGAKRQGRKKWKWTAASYRFYKLQARSLVGIFVFCSGGGLYPARAQENLRASPPWEGGGGAPPPNSNRDHRNRLRCTCRRSRRSYAFLFFKRAPCPI
jgi:hypothetical protein